jgi:hypothetical protein
MEYRIFVMTDLKRITQNERIDISLGKLISCQGLKRRLVQLRFIFRYDDVTHALTRACLDYGTS